MRALRFIWWEGNTTAAPAGPSATPRGNITYPVGVTVSGEVQFIVSVTEADGDYDSIFLYIDGVLVSNYSWLVTPSVSLRVSTQNYSDGTYGAFARLFDVSGNSFDTASVTFYVGNSVFVPPAFGGSFIASPTSGIIPVSVSFTASISGSVAQILWDFNGDGNFDASTSTAVNTFAVAGTYSPVMRLISGLGSVVDITNSNYLTYSVFTTGTGDVTWRSWRTRL